MSNYTQPLDQVVKRIVAALSDKVLELTRELDLLGVRSADNLARDIGGNVAAFAPARRGIRASKARRADMIRAKFFGACSGAVSKNSGIGSFGQSNGFRTVALNGPRMFPIGWKTGEFVKGAASIVRAAGRYD